MKKLILNISLFLGIALSVTAQNVYIPDTNFKTALLGNNLLNTDNDPNNISVQEANNYSGQLNFYSGNITSFKGLENFTKITSFVCNYSVLDSIDITANTELISFSCYYCRLKTMDFSKNTKLNKIELPSSSLTSIDLSSNINLTDLDLTYNSLNYIDLSRNVNLVNLTLSYNNLLSSEKN